MSDSLSKPPKAFQLKSSANIKTMCGACMVTSLFTSDEKMLSNQVWCVRCGSGARNDCNIKMMDIALMRLKTTTRRAEMVMLWIQQETDEKEMAENYRKSIVDTIRCNF